jgi:exodeoxyribonuclease VII large subunit
LSDRADRALRGKFSLSRERFIGLSHRLHIRNPALEVERFRERLLLASDRMASAMRHLIEGAREKNAVHAARLSVLSPLATLERGYSITRSSRDGVIVRSSDQLQSGDHVDVTFRHGRACCVVETLESGSGTANLEP